MCPRSGYIASWFHTLTTGAIVRTNVETALLVGFACCIGWIVNHGIGQRRKVPKPQVVAVAGRYTAAHVRLGRHSFVLAPVVTRVSPRSCCVVSSSTRCCEFEYLRLFDGWIVVRMTSVYLPPEITFLLSFLGTYSSYGQTERKQRHRHQIERPPARSQYRAREGTEQWWPKRVGV